LLACAIGEHDDAIGEAKLMVTKRQRDTLSISTKALHRSASRSRICSVVAEPHLPPDRLSGRREQVGIVGPKPFEDCKANLRNKAPPRTFP
jgi:hypothetical protein